MRQPEGSRLQCSVLRAQAYGLGARPYMAQWLSWLERRPVTAKVVGSSPIWVAWRSLLQQGFCWYSSEKASAHTGDLSSAGRASVLQTEGHRFEPYRSHESMLICCQPLVVYADVAQLAEQLICNQQVIGSSPIIGSEKSYIMDGFPSGQRGQTVNLLQIASVVRIHLHPLAA